ncbi:hypothetical protein U1Q18_026881, partial [Sarracenia purpurea var. burkii]
STVTLAIKIGILALTAIETTIDNVGLSAEIILTSRFSTLDRVIVMTFELSRIELVEVLSYRFVATTYKSTILN